MQTNSRISSGVIKYNADIVPVSVVAATLAAGLLPFLVHLPVWALVPYLFALYFARTYTPFAQHNHAHLAVFKSPVLNGLYNVVLGQCTGYPTALWELHHNRGHHRNFLTPEHDVASIVDRRTGRNMSRWMYALRGNLTIHRDAIGIGKQEGREGKKTLLPKLFTELAIQLAIWVGLVWWNPLMAAFCMIIPCLFSAWMIWWESYPHHLEVPTSDLYDGSVTITSPVYNVHTFNIGHHTAHHEKPTLHWSLLPARTEAIKARIPEMCLHNRYYRSARRQVAETRVRAVASGAFKKAELVTVGGNSV